MSAMNTDENTPLIRLLFSHMWLINMINLAGTFI